MQGFALHEFHHEKRHCAARDSKVRDGDDVRVADGGGGQGVLTKARDQHRVVANEVWQDDFDGVRGFEKDMTGFEDDAHAAMPESFLQLVTTVQHRLARD